MRLTTVAQAALGRRLRDITRVSGGTRKGVYRITADDGATAIAYVWDDAENYWPGEHGQGDLADPFTAGSGAEMFLASRARLESLGLRVPAVRLVDGEIAVVEDFPGDDLMERLARDPAAMAPTMARLAENLAAMRAYRAPAYGKVLHVDRGGVSHGSSCEGLALDFGLRCLAEAAGRDARIAGARDRLEARLRSLAGAVAPRSEFSVVHGELGLDHVMVDADGLPVLIDVEDVKYFDVEWEHVFLKIRLNDDYHYVAADGLDEARMDLYMLVQRLSLTAGPLRLLDGDFPDRSFMRAIAEYNLNQALSLAHSPGS